MLRWPCCRSDAQTVALRVDHLTLFRGGLPVLQDVSFGLAPGKALILRGPNGAGKTTLLRAIAGLSTDYTGGISGAEDQVAYAGHTDGIKSMLTVAENLTFWAEVFGSAGIAQAMERFQLEPLKNRLAGTLSAGQKRRLGLARLLVTGRPLWVLDEPTVSLDANAVGLFAGIVEAHLADGGSALIATHIDLGLEAEVLDVSAYRATTWSTAGASDEAFL